MPFYEYSCESCGHELEALQRLSAEPLVDCPACGAAALRKKVSAAAFRLKGTGWYETDFKDSGKPKTEGNKDSKADGKQEAATDDSSAKSSDSATDGGKSTASSPTDSDKSSGKSQGTSAKKDSGSTSASAGTD